MIWPHFHHWVIHWQNAVGIWEKQEGQSASKIYVFGRIEKCEKCQALRILPFNKKLQTVEVEEV